MALVAWYKLDGNLNDSSGQGNVATSSNLTWVDGKIGQGGKLSSGLLTVPSTPLESFTIAFWVKHNDYTYPKVFAPVKKSAGATYMSGVVGWDFNHGYNANGVDITINDGTTLVRRTLTHDNGFRPHQLLNQWVHITYVVDRVKNRVIVYINGKEQSDTLDISSVKGSISNNAPLTVGGMYGWWLDGAIDDVRIYNNVISNVEIAELAKAKVLHYTFNDYVESTLNFVGNQGKSTGGTLSGWGPNQTVTLSNAVNKLGKMGIKCVSNQSSSTPGMYVDLTLTSGKVYTFSAEVQSDCHIFFGYLTTATYTPKAKYDFPSKVSVTFTASANAVRLYFFMLGMSSGQYFIATDIQVEEGATPTKFVHNTRTDTIYDASGYTHNTSLPVSTSPRWTEDCAIGVGAFQFDGTRYISSPLPTIPANGDFTVSFWGFTQDNQHQCFVCTRTATGNGFSIFLLNNRQIRIDTEVSYQWYPRYTLPLNTWVHIAVVVKQSISKALYINGVLFSSTSAVPSGNLSIGTYQTIGVSQSNGTSFGNYLKGKVDDFRVYVTALGADDIEKLYKVKKILDSRGNLSVSQIKEYPMRFSTDPSLPISERIPNFLDPWLFLSFSNSTKNPNITTHLGRTTWEARPAWMHPYLGFSGMFKSNTQYKIHITIAHSTFYDGQYRPGGIWVRYTDGTGDSCTTMGDVGTWKTNELITAENKTIEGIGLYYFVSETVWFDLYDSYMIELPRQVELTHKSELLAHSFSQAGPSRGLTAWYPLNGTAENYVGTNGTPYNVTPAVGHNGKMAYQFNGSNAYIATLLPVEDWAWTITCWMYHDGNFTIWEGVVTGGGGERYPLLLNYGKLGMYDSSFYTSGTIPSKKWIFVVAMCDGVTSKILIDNVVVASKNIAKTVKVDYLGKHYSGASEWYRGRLQDVRVYNRALENDELDLLYELSKYGGKEIIKNDEVYITGEYKIL